MLWYEGTPDTSSTWLTNAYFDNTDAVLEAIEEVLGAPVILVQLSSRGVDDPNGSARNLLYQRVREVQRRMAEGARRLAVAGASEARPGRYRVVTHDLPMADRRHLRRRRRSSSAGAWRWRRVSIYPVSQSTVRDRGWCEWRRPARRSCWCASTAR